MNLRFGQFAKALVLALPLALPATALAQSAGSTPNPTGTPSTPGSTGTPGSPGSMGTLGPTGATTPDTTNMPTDTKKRDKKKSTLDEPGAREPDLNPRPGTPQNP